MFLARTLGLKNTGITGDLLQKIYIGDTGKNIGDTKRGIGTFTDIKVVSFTKKSFTTCVFHLLQHMLLCTVSPIRARYASVM